MTTTLHHSEPVPADDSIAITCSDESITDAECYRLWSTSDRDGTPDAQPGHAIVSRSAGRIGICWGGNYEWADIHEGETVDDLARMSFVAPELYGARN